MECKIVEDRKQRGRDRMNCGMLCGICMFLQIDSVLDEPQCSTMHDPDTLE